MKLVEHSRNQIYADYIQPLNQNVFEVLNSRAKTLGFELGTKRILDFGCNVGHLLTTSKGQIAPANYVGVDINEQALALARTQHPSASWVHYNKYNNTFNPEGDRAAKIPVEGRFDVVVAYGVFTHFFWSEIEETIAALRRHLAPGGILLFSVWEDVDYYGYLGFLDRYLGINVQLSKPLSFEKGFVLANRERLLVDEEKPDSDAYRWIESFYRSDFITRTLPGARRLEGYPTKHPVYGIFAE